jgi:TfoX/Sxy family transcriptional regulator of competence genes
MAYDEALARRVRTALEGKSGLSERKMFGGLAFMVQGNMCCGIVREELMVRVGPEQYEQALANPFSREIDFTGRPMKGMVMVSRAGVERDADLAGWVKQGYTFAATLPAK